MVGLAVCLVTYSNYVSVGGRLHKCLAPLSFLGVASYSLYLSHQLLFAFYRYAFNDEISLSEHVLVLGGALLLGLAFYFLFEKPLSAYISKTRNNMYRVNAVCVVAVVCVIGVAGYYYRQGGLVRDIPELNFRVGQNGLTPEQYNERVFAFDKDFEANGKKNILVIGDSYGRDWVNILLESGVGRVMNISYRTEPDSITLARIDKANYIFVANNGSIFKKYAEIIPVLMKKDFYRVGVKSYGSWAGLVYNNDRYGADYFKQTVRIIDDVYQIDKEEKILFKDSYIDMLSPLKVDDNHIKIFTESQKMISQDCLHVTRDGALYYAERLDVWQYLK